MKKRLEPSPVHWLYFDTWTIYVHAWPKLYLCSGADSLAIEPIHIAGVFPPTRFQCQWKLLMVRTMLGKEKEGTFIFSLSSTHVDPPAHRDCHSLLQSLQ